MSTDFKNPSLVILSHGQAVTTTLAIAEGTGNEHASVILLVRKHLSDYEEFGRVRFEIAPFATAGGTQQREIAILNEHQATLLITFMRNSPVVIEFKKRLVREFFAMAKQIREIETAAMVRPEIEVGQGFPTSGNPFDNVQASKLGKLLRTNKSAAYAYLIECGVTPEYVQGTLQKHNVTAFLPRPAGSRHGGGVPAPLDHLALEIPLRAERQDAHFWYVLKPVFAEICGDFDPVATARMLSDQGLLKRSGGGHGLGFRINGPGGRMWVYAISKKLAQHAQGEAA